MKHGALEFEGNMYKYRTDGELVRLNQYIKAVILHRANSDWHLTAKLVGHPDYQQLRNSCRYRLKYSTGRHTVSIDDVKEAVKLHQAGGDPDEIAKHYGITKSAMFQRARNQFGYYMSTKTFTLVKDEDGAGLWANILYNPVLSFVV